MYKNIIFDFYGTLVKIEGNEQDEYIWNKLSLYMAYQGAKYDAVDLKESYNKNVEKYRVRYSSADYPEVDITDVFYKLYSDKGVKAKSKLLKQTALVFRTLTTENLSVYEGAEEMLIELKKKNKQLFLLSNAQRLYLLAEMKMLGLDKYFDGVYISSDYHTRKPDPQLYKMLIEKEKLKKSDTIMVGDEYSTDIKGAIKAGLDTLYFLSETSDKKAKKEESTYSVLDGSYKKIIKLLTK